jgi:hypothetical protein
LALMAPLLLLLLVVVPEGVDVDDDAVAVVA